MSSKCILYLISLVSAGYVLEDVYIKPGFPGRKYPGEIQIHSNGIRYLCGTKSEDQTIDIVYDNIEHIIFQSCEGESFVILHIRLKKSIIVGKKRSLDIQFYRDVLENSIEETSGRRKRFNYTDEDEVLEEQEELRRKEQADDDFEKFGLKIAECSNDNIVLEFAERDSSFPGIVQRQNVLVRYTDESILYISDAPFFISSWRNIEIAYLERIVVKIPIYSCFSSDLRTLILFLLIKTTPKNLSI